MKRILVSILAVFLCSGVASAASAPQATELTVAIPAGNYNIGDVDLASSIPAGDALMGSVAISSFNVSLPAGNSNIGDVDLASSVPAGDNNMGDVDIASIAAGVTTIGSVTMLGNNGVAVKMDAAGQIYAIASTIAGAEIEKAWIGVNIAIGSDWVEIGSYTVTAGKSMKIFETVFVSGFDTEFKLTDGTPSRDIHAQTSPASPSFIVTSSHPLAKAAETVVTVLARCADTGNLLTVRMQAFEYTP